MEGRQSWFQTRTVGNYPDASTVADKDNIYLSEQGWVYRHYKNAEKTKYWDEIITGFVDRDNTDNLPVGIFGAEQQDFLVAVLVSSLLPAIILWLSPLSVLLPSQTVALKFLLVTPTPSGLENDGSFSGTKTYLWKVFEGSTDVTADTNKVTSVTGGTAQSATITFAAAGVYTVKCTVGDQAGTQASVTGAMEVAVVAADATHTIGTVVVTGPIRQSSTKPISGLSLTVVTLPSVTWMPLSPLPTL